MSNYIDQFCISCKYRYTKEKYGREYCKLTDKPILVTGDRCENWEKKSLYVDVYYE